MVIHDSDKNPAGNDVYFVSGDVTNADDLRRAGIEEAMAAVVCPADASNEADMRSILTVMAIESIAPQVRTVVEVNNPQHVDHFRRANADEIMVTSRISSRLLARSSLYPGLAEIVTDIVSGGEGSELYRVALPDEFIGLSVDELSARLRAEHSATLLAIGRNGHAHVNPPHRLPAVAGRRRRRGRRVARHARAAGGLDPGLAASGGPGGVRSAGRARCAGASAAVRCSRQRWACSTRTRTRPTTTTASTQGYGDPDGGAGLEDAEHHDPGDDGDGQHRVDDGRPARLTVAAHEVVELYRHTHWLSHVSILHIFGRQWAFSGDRLSRSWRRARP